MAGPGDPNETKNEFRSRLHFIIICKKFIKK
ncbi:MAG: hypothetical protein Hyperionvirus3_67 [Hyperionvirus sp.]|uniref:Uncharacterized protein n=1 Tax=Hyperionvirus sp. TaxID=2487770 RepID=A0A3G5A9Q0_9VIRU|nr:MAG: hypothetical protein Hyperionvirus3_67 [Hyperionvirus sp.]